MRLSTSLLLACCLSTSATIASAENWVFDTADDAHNMLMFQVNHQGFSYSLGFFMDFHGVISLDEDNLENSSVWAEIDTNSVDLAQHETWINNTKDLFFDPENHSTMRFDSTSVKDMGDGMMEIEGDLTIVGVTKSITLDAKLNRIGQYMEVGPKAGFSATTSLDRTEWGVDAILNLIPAQVEIEIQIEAFPEGMDAEH